MRMLRRLLGLTTGPDILPPMPSDQWERAELQQALRDLEVAESLFREAENPRSVDMAAYRLKLAEARVLIALGRCEEPQEHPVPWLAGDGGAGDGPPAEPASLPPGDSRQE